MRPAYRITADDVDVTEALARDLVSLTLTDKPGLDADEIELRITDATGRLALPRRGVLLRVAIGWAGSALVDRGTYRVDEVRHKGPPDVITIKGRAADLTGGLKEQREASYHDTTLGAVLSVIAQRQGLTPAIAPDLARVVVPHVDQTNESDAHFVTRLAGQHDAIGSIKDGHLLFTPRGSGATASGGMLPTLTIARADSVNHDFSVKDRDGKTTGVKAQWRDYDASQTVAETVGREGGVTTLKRVYPTRDEARAAAESAMRGLMRGQKALKLKLVRGRPDVIAGQPLAVTGFRPEINGVDWITDTVKHTLTGGTGFTTDIDAEERVPPNAEGGDGTGGDDAETTPDTTPDDGMDWGS